MPTKLKLVREKRLTDRDLLKYEIACELGLDGKIQASGWRSLTARESGKIGGLLAKRDASVKKLEEVPL
jgi:hypothetical protein